MARHGHKTRHGGPCKSAATVRPYELARKPHTLPTQLHAYDMRTCIRTVFGRKRFASRRRPDAVR